MPRCPFPGTSMLRSNVDVEKLTGESVLGAIRRPSRDRPGRTPSVQRTRARAFPFPLGGRLRGPRHQTVTVSVTDGPHQHVIGRTRAHLSPTVASEGMPWNDERNAMTP